ncbi:hypothetical protein SKAU_G00376840 [Synaphobranchus kaupii]|uniref:Uncharacterized protein n=1 Tax=Synaphobranchus kaupii TaxID=118154 RepID=A0A9Q1IEA4_SYNKA|nr:hypothetical protein SKAU_G00376840 [Synaphobranchus kaupii]
MCQTLTATSCHMRQFCNPVPHPGVYPPAGASVHSLFVVKSPRLTVLNRGGKKKRWKTAKDVWRVASASPRGGAQRDPRGPTRGAPLFHTFKIA